MVRYIVIKGIGSENIVHSGDDEEVALGALCERGYEMYEIDLNPNAHGLRINKRIYFMGQKKIVEGIRIHRKVLDALLEDSEAQTEVTSSREPLISSEQ